MAIISDRLEGRLRHTADGWADKRVYLVTGVTGDGARRKWDAVNTPGIPRRGDPHPHAPGATVESVAAEPYSDKENETFTVIVDYGGDSTGTAESLQGSGIKGLDISTTTATTTRKRDFDGNWMQVVYQGRIFEVQLSSQVAPRDVSWYYYSGILEAEIEISLLRAVVTVERSLPSRAEHHRVKMSTNGSLWSGDPQDTWICLGVDSSMNDSGTFDWRYQLAHSDQTWLFRGEVESVTQSPFIAETATIGNGIELFQQYRRIDFATLGFEIP